MAWPVPGIGSWFSPRAAPPPASTGARRPASQLDRWGVRYDDLQLGKPSADVYVDDRAVHTTAWREGDAYAVPGFGVPAPEGRREPLPEALALQRTTVVESGPHLRWPPVPGRRARARLRRRAVAAGIARVPAATRADRGAGNALARAREAGDADLVFTFAVADAVAPASWTWRTSARTAPWSRCAGSTRCLPGWSAPPTSWAGVGRQPSTAGWRSPRPANSPDRSGTCWPRSPADAGIEVAAEALEPADLGRATEVFEAVEALGLVPVAPEAARPKRPRCSRQARGGPESQGGGIVSAVVAIPARLQSSRLPDKLLLDVAGRPLIQRTHDVAVAAGCGTGGGAHRLPGDRRRGPRSSAARRS